ncbi:polymeric immunoglobulin receptor-like [Scleropages formosus]|uniref:polymeric immunoglobulin receptor-like n=1 Tax=Scleropages formosus TaxID=113540 RepID=UPI0010FA6827|nr:polymeric immunoglobulin receptor-like [Scleropages formosus]
MWTESWSHTESGGSVTIPCHYHQRYKEHVKYWCKGYTWSSCSTMVRSDSPQSKGEVSITDDPDKLVFNVTMRNLQENCSGTFWCGVEINGVPAYGAILVLNVTAGSSVVPQETTVNTVIESKVTSASLTQPATRTQTLNSTSATIYPGTSTSTIETEDSKSGDTTQDTQSHSVSALQKFDTHMASLLYLVLLIFTTVPGNGCVRTSKNISQPRGGSVTIPCYYDYIYIHHVKYWCKGYTWSSCSTMVRTDTPQWKGDVSIADDPDQRVFYVTMRNLKEEDSGWYWCGVETGGIGIAVYLTALYLTVTPGVWAESWMSALRGESVTIQCRYDQRYKHSVKYWCKWETWSSCSTMVRSGSPQRKGDVSIADDPDQLVFTVTMRNVQEKDAGTYWCGVDIGGTGTMDDSAYIYLTVYADRPDVSTEGWLHGESGGSVTIRCHYDQIYKYHVKFGCKWYHRESCSTMVSSDSAQTEGDVSITDYPNQLVFTVTIMNVQEKDAGWYWCGVETDGTRIYLKSVHISVTGSSAVPQKTTAKTIIESKVTPASLTQPTAAIRRVDLTSTTAQPRGATTSPFSSTALTVSATKEPNSTELPGRGHTLDVLRHSAVALVYLICTIIAVIKNWTYCNQ